MALDQGHSEKEKREIESAREMFQILMEIATLLDTDLDAQSLTYCIRLCESGVNPDALAQVFVSIKNMVGSYNQEK